MKKVLMVAEKPSLAASLAKILSDGRCSTRKGSNGVCSTHLWTGSFQNAPATFKMTSVCGHVMGVDFYGKYNNWDATDPVELFTCTIEKKEANPKFRMVQFLRDEAKDHDNLVLWLDCDKEGENICFEVMNSVARSLKGNVYSPQITYRAKFSAITDKDIKQAFNNLISPNENEAKSVDARQELDLRIGCAFTRFQTKYFQGKYGDLDSTLISYGPCQTPTLGFCVQRHDEIQSFKPETYWVLQVKIRAKNGDNLALTWDRVRSFDKEVAVFFLQRIKDAKKAKVLSVSTKNKTKPRPVALNTVELMRVASSGLGMGPHYAMQIAERLYTQGYISYPRTETTRYPENFDLKGVLLQQQHSRDWGEDVRVILADGLERPKQGHDAGDHPPITPMKLATKNELDGDSWKLYEYITKHFIGTLAKDCVYQTTTVLFQINDERFSVSGKRLIAPGFTSIMTWLALDKNDTIPEFEENQLVNVVETKITEHQTNPPDYLTEAELITLMEKHGIGTDASIPVHIDNISQRNYVNVIGGRRLKPTTLGIVLVHGYQKIDQELVLPTMRSAVEKQLNLIAQGRADYDAVLKHTTEIFHLKFRYFVANITGMDLLFEVSFSPLSESGKPFSRCGKCRRYLKLISAAMVRLHCTTCDETYNVPQNSTIRLFSESTCPLDNFQLLSCTQLTNQKSYILCPYCYNNPPFPDMKKGSGCNNCPHPTCQFGYKSNLLTYCQCDDGLMILDPSSGPKWKMSCNRCQEVVYIFKDAHKISLTGNLCSQCNYPELLVEYRAEKSKLLDSATEAKGCANNCTEIFPKKLLEFRKVPITNVRRGGRGGRGGSRGGASRGRGGRGRFKPKDKMAQLDAYFV